MIKLTVEEVCENCPNFDAETLTSTMYADAEPVSVEHEIVCSRRAECRNIRRFLERVLGPEDKKKAADA